LAAKTSVRSFANGKFFVSADVFSRIHGHKSRNSWPVITIFVTIVVQ